MAWEAEESKEEEEDVEKEAVVAAKLESQHLVATFITILSVSVSCFHAYT